MAKKVPKTRGKPKTVLVSNHRPPRDKDNHSSVSRAIEFFLCATGLYASFLTWGYMQEKITASSYHNESGDEAKWQFSYVLNLSMSIFALFLAAVVFSMEGNSLKAQSTYPSTIDYFKPALSNTLASPIGYYALRYINFPMLLLAKSCKLVPVMFMGWLLNGEKYSKTQLIAVAFISLGVALFTIKPKDLISLGLTSVAEQFMPPDKLTEALASIGGDEDSLARRLLGLGLVGTNLMFDGYTNSAQKGINDKFQTEEHGPPSPFYSMIQMNGWAVVLMASWLTLDLVLSLYMPHAWRASELLQAVDFMTRFPQIWRDLVLFSATSAVGQLFIFYIIRSFSPVALVTLTVTRKFFSILFSIVRFGHEVYPWQYAGMCVLFIGLLMNDALSMNKKDKPKSH